MENFENEYTECLNEMASVRPSGNFESFGILLAVNPDINHDGDPYFKMYDKVSWYSATKVWRISFTKPVLIKKHSGKIPAATTINTKDKNTLLAYLNSPSRDFSGATVWDELKYRWNVEKGLMNQFGFINYQNGGADKYYEKHKNDGNYLPSTLAIPDYKQI